MEIAGSLQLCIYSLAPVSQAEVACTIPVFRGSSFCQVEWQTDDLGRLLLLLSLDGAASKDPDTAGLCSGSLLLVLVIAAGSPHEQSEVSKAHGEEE